MPDERDVTLWPSRETYSRFRALCDDDVPDTFDEFEAVATSRIDALAREGITIERIDFDPERMAQWCRAHFGKVDANARRHYAAFLALSD